MIPNTCHRRAFLTGLSLMALVALVLLVGCKTAPAAPGVSPDASTASGPQFYAESQAVTGAAGPEDPVLVAAQDGLIRLPIGDLADGVARFYVYEAKGKAIRFFVLQSADGVIRAALDACDVCFPAGLGYRQEGDAMICNNCGSRFPSTSINVIQGGCNPVPLDRQVQGDMLIIQATDLEKGTDYF